MYDIMLIFLIVIITIMLFVALTKATEAAEAIGKSEDSYLISAHSYLTWTVTFLWIIIIGMFVAVGFLIFFGPEFLPAFGKDLMYLMLTILVVAMITVGVISSIAANDIRLSPANATVPNAYDDALEASLFSLIPIGIVVIKFGIVWYNSYKVKQTVPTTGANVSTSQ